jgi:hypothetical protein
MYSLSPVPRCIQELRLQRVVFSYYIITAEGRNLIPFLHI